MENPQKKIKKKLSIKFWVIGHQCQRRFCCDLIGSLLEGMKEILNKKDATIKY